jgi:PPE-repeat protein
MMIDFGSIPPEITSARMYTGAGSGSLMTAAAAWNQVAAELNSAARSYQQTITTLSSDDWQGAASAAMADAAAPYLTWMTNTATEAEQAASQARAAASAYDTALASTVPPPMIAANRVELTQLVSNNVVGQYTAAIAQLEAQYAEMWAQDASTMYSYAGHSAAATEVTPFAAAPQITSPTAQAAQSAATTSATATSAGNSQSTLSQIISSLPNQLHSLASPVSAASSSATTTTDPLTEIYFLLTGNTTLPTNLGSLVTSYSPYSSVYYNTEGLPYFSVGMANFGVQIAKTTGLLGGTGPAAAAAPATTPFSGLGGLGANLGGGGAAVGGGAVKAAAASADVLGRMSVPANWSHATGAMTHPAAVATHTMTPVGQEGQGNLMGGMPVAGSPARGAGIGPKYGIRPTVMSRPPFAG